MKTEHLDELLLDRALGELSPAAAELLDEHLARDPAASLRACELAATVRVAREAVAVRAAPRLPPLPVPEGRKSLFGSVVFMPATQWLRVAAAVIVGLLAGVGIGHRFAPPPPAPPMVQLESGAGAAGASAGFWSATRRTAEFLRPERRTVARSAYPLRWSPAQSSILKEESP